MILFCVLSTSYVGITLEATIVKTKENLYAITAVIAYRFSSVITKLWITEEQLSFVN